MLGRPRLPLNTTGEIRTHQVDTTRWVAIAKHRDPDGRTRQYQRTGPTKAKATARLKKGLADPDHVRTGPTTMTALAARYFEILDEEVRQGERSPGTVRLYRGHWARHGAPKLGGLTLAEAGVPELDRFMLALRSECGPNVAKSVRAVLSGMLGLAARYGAIPSNPVRDVSRIRRVAKPVRALTPSEAVDLWMKLLALAKMPGETVWAQRRTYTPTRIHPYLPDLALWMLGTSQRIGQALALHWPWVDLDAATATLGPNVIRVKGEGLRLNTGTSKTQAQVLDLPETVVAMLLVRRQATHYPLGPVFPDALGGLRDPSNVQHDLRRALGMAGYEWVTSHVFRKTVATVLDDAGLSARMIADQLSHARPSMTQDHYMARKARNPRAVAAIEAMLATEPGQRVVSLDRPN